MRERIPTNLTLGDKKIPFKEIHNEFASTDWGEKLKGNIRWSGHKPSEIKDEDWGKILGRDANNLEHLVAIKGLTLSFLKYCKNPGEKWKGEIPEAAHFSTEEQQLLLLTATVHDWGEAIKGDIPYYHKTEQDHTEEMQELRTIIAEILGKILVDKRSLDIKTITDKILDILTHTDSKLGRAFNIIERVGYVRTCIKAYNRPKNGDEKLETALKMLACRAVPDQIRTLVDYVKIYPPILIYLRHHKETINNIFKDGENPEIRATIPEFERSREKWLTQNSQF